MPGVLSSSKPAADIPVIDIGGDIDINVAAKAMIEAGEQYGFLYIKGKGLEFSDEDVNQAFALSSKFFASPEEEKVPCKITPDSQNRGWSSMHQEVLDPENQRTGDFKEAFNFGEFTDGKVPQLLPKSLQPHESEIGAFETKCRAVCDRILKLLALGLQIPDSEGGESWFASRHGVSAGPSGSILRFLHYPALTNLTNYQPEVDIRAGAHSDYGSITLLFQRPGQSGLEILTRGGGWAPVAIKPPGTEADALPPVLVNFGDLLSHWTNGVLRSTVHRVIFPREARVGGEDRYSIAYFCHPASATELIPVPSEKVKVAGEKRYGKTKDEDAAANPLGVKVKALTAHEHLMSRLNATYKYEKK